MDLTTEQLTDIAQQVRDFLLANSQGVGELTDVTDLTGITSLPGLKVVDGAESVVNVPISLLASQMRVSLTAVQYKNPINGEWIDIIQLSDIQGRSAYEVAKKIDSNIGNEAEWLNSLIGKTAYEIAVKNGYEGTEIQWLEALKGKSAYQLAVTNGFTGTESEWVKSLSSASETAAVLALKAATDLSTQVNTAILGIDTKIAVSTATLKSDLSAKVVTEVADKIAKPYAVSGEETPCGTFNLLGETHTIYERSFVLENLINTVGLQAFTLSDEPLGYNLYASIDGFSVSSGKSIMSEFHNSNYGVADLYVDEEMKTIVTIACKKEVTIPNLKAILHLRYVKFFGDIVEFNVTVPDSIDPANVDLSFPKLKYNKKIAASITVDDSCTTWNSLFSVINKKRVSNEIGTNPWTGAPNYHMWWHKGTAFDLYGTTSYMPTKFIEYTSGTGFNRRFAYSIAAWAWKLGNRDDLVGVTTPWDCASEIRTMQDFGVTVNFHDIKAVSENAGGTNVTQDFFNKSVKIDSDMFYSLIDRRPKINQNPNADINYINKSWGCPYIQYVQDVKGRTGQDGTTNYYYPFNTTYDISDKTLKRISQRDFAATDYLPTDFYNAILAESQKSLELRRVMIYGTHAIYADSGWADALNSLESQLGKSGLDTLWFASIDELFEYFFMIQNTVAVKSVSGKTINYKLFVPTNDNFWFRDLSVLLSGITDLTGITISSSDNCKGTSFAINEGKLMINLDFNTDLEAKAEKYVSKFESSQLYTDYEDAQYFVQQLKTGIKESYQTRLNNLVGAPTLTALSINSGATTTNALGVTLTPTFSGSVTAYMISENSDFSGASWNNYSSGNILFNLSDIIGSHTLYIKLKNDYGESAVVYASINYAVEQLVLSSASINSGAIDTSSRNVNVSYVSTGSPATHYMISENSDFSGASWQTITGTIPFTLSDTAGTKTIYLKLKNNNTETSAVSDTINYTVVPFSLSSVSINAGATDTANKNVNVTIASTGNNVPTQYKISENSDMSGASWQTYTSNVMPFTLSDGYGIKTVYVQITDGTTTSAIVSDSINVPQPIGLTAVSINSGATETTNQTVSVAMTTTGAPTHYMISENSDFSGASWIAFATPASFALSTGYAIKTIYVKVKDSNGESSVISSNINYVAQSEIGRKAVMAIGEVTSYPVINGSTYNVLRHVYYDGYSTEDVKDTAGTAWIKHVQKLSLISSKLTGLGINAVDYSALAKANACTGTSNLGQYADSLINLGCMFYRPVSSTIGANYRAFVGFSNVPNGTYKVRIYTGCGNVDIAKEAVAKHLYAVNDKAEVPGIATVINDVNAWITFDNVVVSDGFIIVTSRHLTATANYIYAAPITMVEITRTA